MPNVLIWHFYSFCKEYARQPVDIDDMLDGLVCMWARSEIGDVYSND